MGIRSIFSVLLLCLFSVGASAANTFEGYSFTLDADDSVSCPIKYLTANAVEVFVAGTNLSQPARDLKACNGSSVQGSKVNTNGDGRWCFEGPEKLYEIKLSTGAQWLWYPTTPQTGFVNVKDFRPVTRSADGSYTFSEPKDYTKTFRNAIQFLTARRGGTLTIPDGDYTVGTLDGERRDPTYQAITLSSGLQIQGAGMNTSQSDTRLPTRYSPTRIRVRHPNQTIFRIGGCTDQITIQQMELMGNGHLAGEAKRDSTGTYGIEGRGLWALNARTKAEAPNSSQVFRFDSLTFQNLDKGIFVHNVGDENCKSDIQLCNAWQFDYVAVENSRFVNNKTGIFIDTGNTEWLISKNHFSYLAQNAPGDGIRIKNGGAILIQQTFGGGYNYGEHIGGTFIYVDAVGQLTIVSSGSERGKRSLYTNPLGAVGTEMITVIGGGFGDPVELNGNLNYTSVGMHYGPNTIKAAPTVTVTSTGDRFCYDPRVYPGHCKDQAGKTLSAPNVLGGRVMFQTGRLPEGNGPERIDGKPNIFGYDLEMRDGLIQHDPNITFSDITKWAQGGDGRPPVRDGALVYCKDCRRGSECSQGSAGKDGAFAKRINGRWMCD